mgnify:CR=1 FL=1
MVLDGVRAPLPSRFWLPNARVEVQAVSEHWTADEYDGPVWLPPLPNVTCFPVDLVWT